MRKRIAPTLQRLTSYPLQRGTWFPPGTTNGDCVQAQRELRALLAVARAARQHANGSGCNAVAIAQAVARLDKVSAKGEP